MASSNVSIRRMGLVFGVTVQASSFCQHMTSPPRPVGVCSRRTPMTPPSVAHRGDCHRGLFNSQSHHARRVHSVAVWHDCVGGEFVEHLSPIITCATAVIGGAQDLTEESYLFNERHCHRNTSSTASNILRRYEARCNEVICSCSDILPRASPAAQAAVIFSSAAR
jgi:hypothetical protein